MRETPFNSGRNKIFFCNVAGLKRHAFLYKNIDMIRMLKMKVANNCPKNVLRIWSNLRFWLKFILNIAFLHHSLKLTMLCGVKQVTNSKMYSLPLPS